MKRRQIKELPIQESWLRDASCAENSIISISIELTSRCNNSCRHCYNNIKYCDKSSITEELGFKEIIKIIDQAHEMGVLWLLLTGGEPLLRKDFSDIYIYAKKKGLLVSIFTNATLLNNEHIKLFKKFPPRDIEITVYGVTKAIYGRVTGSESNFQKFLNGINLLTENNIPFRLKTVVLNSNFEEFEQIREFCKSRTKDYFHFDFELHLRHDENLEKNEIIKSERLSIEKIIQIEFNDPDRLNALRKERDILILNEFQNNDDNTLFRCGIGAEGLVVGCDGTLRLCQSLCHKDYTINLKYFTLEKSLKILRRKVKYAKSYNSAFIQTCKTCQIINLCMWCPARSHLEIGEIDRKIEHFCELAKARAKKLKEL